jgi:2-aminoethylphosphonate-pyruvate transaminase
VVTDICPREKEFTRVLDEIRAQLTGIVAETQRYETVLFGGSGTAAVEAMLSSVVGTRDFLCVANNGAYGKRMSEIGRIHGLPMMEYASDPIRRVDVGDLAGAIDASNRRVTHLAIVHHETTSGVLNNLDGIGRLCKERGIVLLLDAVSSYGAIPINMPGQGIHFLAATANKNIQGMPGVSFVVADTNVLERTAGTQPRSLYLNLYAEYAHVRSTGQTRFTPPVQTCYALRQALRELVLEGVEKRYKRYSACWQVLVDGLTRLGLQIVVSSEDQSRLLTTVQEPTHPKYSFDDMHDAMLARGFTVYPGKLLRQNTFRIANIGAIVPGDIQLFLTHLEKYLASL